MKFPFVKIVVAIAYVTIITFFVLHCIIDVFMFFLLFVFKYVFNFSFRIIVNKGHYGNNISCYFERVLALHENDKTSFRFDLSTEE